jgi:hypothetical protein
LAQFQKILDETAAGQETSLIHVLAKKVILCYRFLSSIHISYFSKFCVFCCRLQLTSDIAKEVNEIDMSSLLALSSLVGIPCVKLSIGPPDVWELFVSFANVNGLPSSAQNGDSNDRTKTFMEYFDVASIPFFIACCIRVNITGLPHESCGSIRLHDGGEMRKIMVRFSPASEFELYLSPPSERVTHDKLQQQYC